MNKRITEDYRKYELVAVYREGKYFGVAWKGKDQIAKHDGASLQDVISKLKASVDGLFVAAANARQKSPSVQEYITAFGNILATLSPGHLAMIKAHYLAPEHSITSTQLANSAGYTNFNSANLQYGSVGKRLYEELPMQLPPGEDGQPVYTFMLAEGSKGLNGSEWVWVMRPEVVSAVEALGLNR